ncbi:hypothetical protein AYI69_g2296 [Smittium culicis]|uniref:Endoplasmic reticulum membrane protein n=1 Tax=Smittium culicis TaxID=133412 RepID=A0A1R1YMY1_9FUNG|nr:hypothetical protein AYI69_g2296 [Smittium culicis]
MPFVNFRKNYVDYGISHYEENNIIVHIICTPLILWSIVGFASFTGPLLPTPDWLAPFIQFSPEGSFDLSLGAFIILFYFIYAILIDVVYAALFFPFFIAFLTTSNYIILNSPNSFHIFYLTFISASFLNHASHYFVEKRSPRVYHGSIFAIFFAFFYASYTFIMHLGYRSEFYNDLRIEIHSKIQSLNKKSNQKS